MESKSLGHVYEEYVAKYGEPVDIGKLVKYVKRHYNSQWTYQDIRKFVKSHQVSNSTSTPTTRNDDKTSIKNNKVNKTRNSSKTKLTKPISKINCKVKAKGKETCLKPKQKTKTKSKTKQYRPIKSKAVKSLSTNCKQY